MDALDVRIVELPPMRVASFYGFGSGPEMQAWQKMATWATEHGLTAGVRLFGFNNPNPSPGSPNYGYEFWLTVGPEVEPDPAADMTIKTLPGGLYAVTRCKGAENITDTWRELAAWCEDSPYRHAARQWLEEHFAPIKEELSLEDFTLDLYLAIDE